MPELDPARTALVMIDLQKGIVDRELAPRTGAAVIEGSRRVARRFRDAGAPVVLVRVDFAPDFRDAPPGRVDAPLGGGDGPRAADWSELAPDLAEPGDVIVTKRHWGAFHGTELDLQLRRRGVDTIVLGGIATNYGVESTARAAWEHGYHVVVVEDLCASVSTPLHEMSMAHVMPRLSRVVHEADLSFLAR